MVRAGFLHSGPSGLYRETWKVKTPTLSAPKPRRQGWGTLNFFCAGEVYVSGLCC